MNMMDILEGTPWWVFALFFYILIKGLKATKTRPVELKRLILLPCALLSITVVSRSPFSPGAALLGLTSLALGLTLGWLTNRSKEITLKKPGVIVIPGSWSVLLLSLAIFALKYTLGATSAIYPELNDNTLFIATDLLLSGLISGLFFGRFLLFSRRARLLSMCGE